MKPILTLENPLFEVNTLLIFEYVSNDADEILFPAVIDGNYYHFKMEESGDWYAIGLPDDISLFVSMLIERFNLKNGEPSNAAEILSEFSNREIQTVDDLNEEFNNSMEDL